MAIVENIQVLRKDSPRVHPTKTQVFVFTFTGPSGERILQLDSVGSATRQKVGKGSQTLQFGENEARQLLQAIRKAFPHLK